MELNAKYSIAFKALKDGSHDFTFEVDDAFFAGIENSLINGGKLTAEVNLVKSSQMLKFHFNISGIIRATCDICLGEFDYPIEDCEGDMMVKFGETSEEISEDLFQLADYENEINVAQWIYEILAVSLPIRFVHPEDENGNSTCDPEMIERLNQYLVSEDEIKTDEEADKNLPFANLKGLIDKQ
ncbi:MAG: DUF177 domain-containing protein [Bacteroidales bacterium]|nr:DUF177 domain-containing protein [Bacteroidales bacterium]